MCYSILFLTVVILAVSTTFAQDEEFNGRCPFDRIKTKVNFDVNRYQGHWFDIRRYYSKEDTFCVDVDYHWKENEQKYQADITDKLSSKTRTYSVFVSKTSNDGKFLWTFNSTVTRPYWVIETDYSNYALIWSCVEDLEQIEQPTNKQGLWILGRSRTQDVNIPELQNILNQQELLHKDMLRDVQQTTCGSYLAIPSLFLIATIILSKIF